VRCEMATGQVQNEDPECAKPVKLGPPPQGRLFAQFHDAKRGMRLPPPLYPLKT